LVFKGLYPGNSDCEKGIDLFTFPDMRGIIPGGCKYEKNGIVQKNAKKIEKG